jgi:hypothetical protein
VRLVDDPDPAAVGLVPVLAARMVTLPSAGV